MAEDCGFCFSWPVKIILGYLLLNILIRLKNYLTRFKSNQTKFILITGCDSGFGHKTALKLSCNNNFILAGCLTKEGVHRLQVDTAFTGKAFLMDVTNEKDIENVVSIVQDETKDQGEFVCFSYILIMNFHAITKSGTNLRISYSKKVCYFLKFCVFLYYFILPQSVAFFSSIFPLSLIITKQALARIVRTLISQITNFLILFFTLFIKNY